MTETKLKLAGRLPEEAGLKGLAEKLYEQGLGHSLLVIGRMRVDRVAEQLDSDEVRLVFERLEGVGDDLASEALDLLDRVRVARSTGQMLPFPDEPGGEQYRRDATLRVLHEWQLDHDYSDADITARWLNYYGKDSEPAHLGPKHVAFTVLQEFCLETGVLTEEQSQRIRAEAEQQRRDTEPDQPGESDDGPGTEDDSNRLYAGDPVFDGNGVPGHVLHVNGIQVTVQYVVPGHVKPEQPWHLDQVARRDAGATETTTQVEPAAEPDIDSEEPAAPAVPVVAFSDQSGEVAVKRADRSKAAL